MRHDPIKTKGLIERFSLALVSTPLLFAFAVASSSSASAQAINYGALQDIFEEPVTTSATGTPQRASEVAADMTIITADQIRQSGSRSLPEILGMYVAGLNILQEGVNQFDVGMRGYQMPYNARLLVLVDGRQVFIDDYSRTQWDNLPLNIDDIRQVEVVKGASSALFGSNATSGVINIITYNPLYDDHKVVSAYAGTQHAYMGDVTMTQKIGRNAGVKISAGGRREEEYQETAANQVDFVGTRRPYHQYARGNGVVKVSPTVILNGEASISQKRGIEAIPSYDSYSVKSTNLSTRAGWQWNSPIGTIKHDNYVNHNSNEYESGLNVNNGTLIKAMTENSLIVSRLEDMLDVGSDHTFRGMLEYRHKYNINSNTNQLIYEKTTLNEDVFTVGGTWLWRVTDDISWTNAIRYDYNETAPLGGTLDPGSPYAKAEFERAFSTVSANSGLVYKPTDKDTFRATYGRGVQNPSLINTGDNFNFVLLPYPTYPRFQFFSSPYIKPSIVQDYSLGYDRKLPEIDSTVRLTGYYEMSRDVISFTPLTLGGDAYGFYATQGEGNVGKSHGFGGEIALTGQNEDGYRWNVSYSYVKLHDSAPVAANANYQGSAPETQIRVNLGRTIGNWEIDGHAQYLSATSMLRQVTLGVDPVIIPVNNYYTVAARIGYRITDDVTVSLSGTNISGEKTVASPYTVLHRRVLLGLTAKF